MQNNLFIEFISSIFTALKENLKDESLNSFFIVIGQPFQKTIFYEIFDFSRSCFYGFSKKKNNHRIDVVSAKCLKFTSTNISTER